MIDEKYLFNEIGFVRKAKKNKLPSLTPDEITQKVEEYLAKGGKIEVLPPIPDVIHTRVGDAYGDKTLWWV